MLPLPLLNVRLNACHEDWQQMTPTAQGHHCAQCNRTVLDFTNSTQDDLDAAFQTSLDGRVCGRFRHSQLTPPPQLRPKLRRFLVALVLVCGLGLTSGEAWAQARKASASNTATIGKSNSNDTGNKIVCYFPPMPTYKDGGSAGLMRFIAINARYPTGHQESGRVYISFVVTATGKVTDVHLQKGLGKPFDEEAIRVVEMLGAFTPVVESGKPTSTSFTVPVFFTPKKKVE